MKYIHDLSFLPDFSRTFSIVSVTKAIGCQSWQKIVTPTSIRYFSRFEFQFFWSKMDLIANTDHFGCQTLKKLSENSKIFSRLHSKFSYLKSKSINTLFESGLGTVLSIFIFKPFRIQSRKLTFVTAFYFNLLAIYTETDCNAN